MREIAITVVLCGTLLLAARWISEGQRYEVVAVGASSGGSQDSTGSSEVRGFLVDRKTGRTWSLRDVGGMPMDLPDGRYSCKQMSPDWVESDSGCEIPRKP
jgi:hypothetical protein